MRLVFTLLLSLVLGCQTRITTTPASAPVVTPTLVRPTRAWEVVQSDRVVGVVVEFDGGSDSHRFYSVRNAWQQELGLVDGVGRTWRYRPHVREAEWLGSGTIAEGAARVLGIAGELELYEVQLAALREEASETFVPKRD